MNPRHAAIFSLTIIFVIVATIAGIWIAAGTKPPQQSPGEGQEAPDFTLEDLSGKPFSLSGSRGRVVVIDFMATWCGPCRQEMPHLKTVWENYYGRIILISIDTDPTESAAKLMAYKDEFPYATWIWARDTVNVSQAYGVSAIPTIVIVGKDGSIVYRYVGVVDSSTLIGRIDQLLG